MYIYISTHNRNDQSNDPDAEQTEESCSTYLAPCNLCRCISRRLLGLHTENSRTRDPSEIHPKLRLTIHWQNWELATFSLTLRYPETPMHSHGSPSECFYRLYPTSRDPEDLHQELEITHPA